MPQDHDADAIHGVTVKVWNDGVTGTNSQPVFPFQMAFSRLINAGY